MLEPKTPGANRECSKNVNINSNQMKKKWAAPTIKKRLMTARFTEGKIYTTSEADPAGASS